MPVIQKSQQLSWSPFPNDPSKDNATTHPDLAGIGQDGIEAVENHLYC